jgi:DNA modification methylase
VIALDSVRFAERRLRRHSAAKRRTLARSLQKHSQLVPIVLNAANVVVDGHARVDVARELGWTTIMAVRVEHLTDEDLRLFAIAANKLVQDAEWDLDELRIELEELEAALPTIDLTLSGWSTPEIDTLRGAHRAALLNDLVDEIPIPPAATAALAQPGDLFCLGEHRLVCGDATDPGTFETLMGEELADQLFTDPPYNVPIQGHVSGKRKVRHREFAVASGELTYREFVVFLKRFLETSAAHLSEGALAYVCMDHAHLGELLEAGAEVFTERKAICVWDKGAGGMGSLYRNAHELVTVFKKGTASHINNVALGKHGRNRTTVWRYPGMAQLGKGRAKALELHPTVKPVALVADALLDASPANGIVLDPFAGSGTTLIAAETVGRRSRLVELDPVYVDTIIARFERFTGTPAIHAETGLSFAALHDERARVTAQPHHTGDGE